MTSPTRQPRPMQTDQVNEIVRLMKATGRKSFGQACRAALGFSETSARRGLTVHEASRVISYLKEEQHLKSGAAFA